MEPGIIKILNTQNLEQVVILNLIFFQKKKEMTARSITHCISVIE